MMDRRPAKAGRFLFADDALLIVAERGEEAPLLPDEGAHDEHSNGDASEDDDDFDVIHSGLAAANDELCASGGGSQYSNWSRSFA